MSRVLSLAELAGHIERSSLPRGWLPKLGAKKRFPILYASEDRALLACADVPFEFRILYGFLHREGVRRGEAASLKAWAKLREAEPEERVFTDQFGRPLQLDHLTDVLRVHLTKAGLTRGDLTSGGPNKGQFGTHCFRRSMVTRTLALGRNEDWVRQRTGHKSEQLLTYRQAAKSLAELDPGEVDPLALAIPEFADGSGVGHEVGHDRSAPVAELADAQDSGSCARKGVSVRPRPGAPA